MKPDNAMHLGDGAYVTFDGYGFLLTANHHDPKIATDTVWLEPTAMELLIEFTERIKAQAKEDE
jgi:hypothetical protein